MSTQSTLHTFFSVQKKGGKQYGGNQSKPTAAATKKKAASKKATNNRSRSKLSPKSSPTPKDDVEMKREDEEKKDCLEDEGGEKNQSNTKANIKNDDEEADEIPLRKTTASKRKRMVIDDDEDDEDDEEENDNKEKEMSDKVTGGEGKKGKGQTDGDDERETKTDAEKEEDGKENHSSPNKRLRREKEEVDDVMEEEEGDAEDTKEKQDNNNNKNRKEKTNDSDDDDDDDDDDDFMEEDIAPSTKKENKKKKKDLSSVLKDNTSAKKTTKKSSNKTANGKFTKSEVIANKMKDDKTLQESISWSGKLPYVELCSVLDRIEQISGRLEIQEILTDLFRQVIRQNAEDMYSIVYLVSNSVAPAYECLELGIGDAILVKAVGEAYGTNPDKIKKQYEKEGDLGVIAQTSKGKQRTLGFGAKPKPLLAREVLSVFRDIAKTTGAKSQKWKVDKIKMMLVRAKPIEAKYIIRGLRAKLRVGVSHSTVLVALAHALTLSPPEAVQKKESEENPDGLTKDDEDEDTEQKCKDTPEEAVKYANKKIPKNERLEAAVVIVKKAYSEVPSYGALLDAALSSPLHHMHKICSLQPGIPVEPMLAKPTKSIQEVLKRLNGLSFTCEYKYDGERAQVHMLANGTTKVFSRNLLDTSEKFPEVPLYVKEACVASKEVKSFVLDAEVVAFNRETGNLVPFQILSTRKKTEESAETAKVQVIVQAFDLMYLNGESLLHKTLAERRKLLRDNFAPVEGKFEFARSLDLTENGDTGVLEEFLDFAVKGQCEGLMVKTLDVNAVYEPSKRSLNWLKLKKDYLEGLGDSVDLVPLGAYNGRGKRAGVYGAYLLACFDPETEDFQSVCKIGTGFSDKDLKRLAAGFKDHVLDSKSPRYKTSEALECDVWFDAVSVWEVRAADLSMSSAHKGALGRTGEAGRGIGLRFPRFERERTDKKPEDATTSDQILEMYYQQDTVTDNNANDDDDGI